MKIVFLGATKGMGRALARALSELGLQLFLLWRVAEEVQRSARDLVVRARGTPTGGVGTDSVDLLRPETFEPALTAAEEQLGGFDTVVVTAGMFATQEAMEQDPDLAARVLTANFANTVLFCEAARKRLLARGGGTLCVFSSVAGERGRKPVALYGAAKAGLSRYLEALDHKYRAAGLRTVTVKPGFVKTSMTAGLRPPPFAGTPEAIVPAVTRAITRGTPVVYVPFMWRWIMLVIRWLPRFVMRRVGF